jgi:hypothetical protein
VKKVRWWDASLPPRRPGFDPGSVHVGFVVDKVALGQVFLRVLRFFPVSFIPSVLHNNHRVAQDASRLRCVRSVCCGALHQQGKEKMVGTALLVALHRRAEVGQLLNIGVGWAK